MPWARFPVAPLFFLSLCRFKGLRTVTAQIIYISLQTWVSPFYQALMMTLRFFRNHIYIWILHVTYSWCIFLYALELTKICTNLFNSFADSKQAHYNDYNKATTPEPSKPNAATIIRLTSIYGRHIEDMLHTVCSLATSL